MIKLLNELWGDPIINLLRYITSRSGAASMLAFLLSLFLGQWVIRKLISLKIGQPIRTAEEVHKLAELHGQKAGTPTMGGILILGTMAAAVLLLADLTNPYVFVVMFVTLGHGAIGFLDDYRKVAQKNSKGISARMKLGLQILIAGSAASFLYFSAGHQTRDIISSVYLPFLPADSQPLVNLGIFCIPLFIIVIVGASNAVNLTDGLDGLATGCTITTAGTLGVITYVVGREPWAKWLGVPHLPYSGELTVVCFALIGACLGFLWFNCHPAKVFMGDTGSLAIGACLATIAICCKAEFVLAIAGGIFVMEAGSVILQVASFKLRKKRIFRMSPIHHHFELLGWKESQVIARFWILSLIFGFIALASLKIR